LRLDGVVAIPVSDDRRTTVALAWREGPLTQPVETLRDQLLDRARQGTLTSPPTPR
jgi:hypothetical protein